MKLKKILASILCIAMVLGTMGITVFAAGDTTAEDAVASIGDKYYSTVALAMADAQKGDIIELISDVTLTEGIKTDDSNVLSDITLDGNGHIITLDMNGAGTGIRFGGEWATGVKIYDLTINGSAKYALWLNGGTSSVIKNLTITGDYDDVYGGLILYGTHGATMTNCNIVSGFTNGQDDYPLNLINTKIGHLTANVGTAGDGPKTFLDATSSIDEVFCCTTSSVMLDPASVDKIGKIKLEVEVAPGEFAEVEPAAKVAGIYYASLEDAIAAAVDDDTITLLADAEISSYIQFSKNITIDLGGNTLNMTAEPNTAGFYPELRKCSYYITADVTFANGAIVVSNTEYASHGIFFVEVNKSLAFDDVDLTTDGINAFALIQTYGDLAFVNETGVSVSNESSTFVYSEENLGDVNVNNSAITLENVNGGITGSGIGFNATESEITMTNVNGNGLANANGTVTDTVISITNAENAIKNTIGTINVAGTSVVSTQTALATGSTTIVKCNDVNVENVQKASGSVKNTDADKSWCAYKFEIQPSSNKIKIAVSADVEINPEPQEKEIAVVDGTAFIGVTATGVDNLTSITVTTVE